jgi:uncharacterized membrane protein
MIGQGRRSLSATEESFSLWRYLIQCCIVRITAVPVMVAAPPVFLSLFWIKRIFGRMTIRMPESDFNRNPSLSLFM